jgi:thiosulfate/3-mercaptopyruvate sulfurtransferase
MDFLIEAAALRALAAPQSPLLLDTRKPEAYARGHLPGALNLSSYDRFVKSTRAADLADFRAEMASVYAAAGVSPDRPVVVYEDDTGMRAARELWILEYLGHRHARMLHGGLRAWVAAGGALSLEVPAARAAVFEPVADASVVIDAEDLLALSRAGRIVVLDVRDADEFAGRDHTACCTRRGHIPGAVWLEWTVLLDPGSGRIRPPDEVRAALAARGVPPDATLVPYCHRGARSANTYYALRAAGCPSVRNYIGSFHEWSARGELPVEA